MTFTTAWYMVHTKPRQEYTALENPEMMSKPVAMQIERASLRRLGG